MFPLEHVDVGVGAMRGAFINSKGFGGNNATALIIAASIGSGIAANRCSGRCATRVACASGPSC